MIPAFMQIEREPFGITRPPPRHRAVTAPRTVRLVPWVAPPERLTPAKKAGVRYERAFNAFARKLWGPSYRTFEDAVLAFDDVDGPRACRPDGVLVFNHIASAVIFEAKVHHISDSYFQLRELYEPVVRKFLLVDRVVCIEVVRHFDPLLPYPCRTQLLNLLEVQDYVNHSQPSNEVGVWVWKDK
jgi:hypothetical protein